jgi:carbon-monoxide dehydrogenase medium subunit
VPLAGGQSLMPTLNFRVVAPDHLVDLSHIDALSPSTSPTAPALRRHDAPARSRSRPKSRALPDLHEALRHVGHRRTRNRGTFGGSLCHLDPSAELVNMVALHDGVLEAASHAGGGPSRWRTGSAAP